MKFINRETENMNRKTLNIVDVSYNSSTGEISSLVVDESNNDGPVIIEGTKLNAQNLNNAFEYLNRNKFMHFYFKEVFGIDIEEENYTLEFTGNSPKTIEISYDGISPLYPSLTDVYNPNFNIIINETTNPQTITIRRSNNMQASDAGRIFINVYKSASENTFITKLNFKYTYNPSSTHPED